MSCLSEHRHHMDSHALLILNAHEDHFLPAEVKVEWLSKQASMRSRASAMVGSRISQLDDAIRVRALLSVLRSTASTAPAETSPTAAAVVAAPATAGDNSSPATKEACLGQPEEGCPERRQQHVRTGSAPSPSPEDMEVFARMAVAKIKIVLFQVVSAAEKREREMQGRDLFDVYEGLVTGEALERAAMEGFPTLDVDTLMLPKHFRYRSLVAARHRYLLRKLGVLLDMEEGMDSLLKRAVDTERMDLSSLADVDLSTAEDDVEEQEEEDSRSSLESASSRSAASVLALASDAASDGASDRGLDVVTKSMSTLRSTTAWEKDDKDAGSEDTTEGETDEETATPPHGARRHSTVSSPSH